MSLAVFAIAAAIVAAIAGVTLIAARRPAAGDAGLAQAEATVRAAMIVQRPGDTTERRLAV